MVSGALAAAGVVVGNVISPELGGVTLLAGAAALARAIDRSVSLVRANREVSQAGRRVSESERALEQAHTDFASALGPGPGQPPRRSTGRR